MTSPVFPIKLLPTIGRQKSTPVWFARLDFSLLVASSITVSSWAMCLCNSLWAFLTVRACLRIRIMTRKMNKAPKKVIKCGHGAPLKLYGMQSPRNAARTSGNATTPSYDWLSGFSPSPGLARRCATRSREPRKIIRERRTTGYRLCS